MEQNKIEGVKPFNEFFFRSCYYQQLMAGVSCLGVDQDLIIFNIFTEIGEDFVAGKEELLNDKKLGKIAGYKRIKTEINKKKLIRCIDNNQPIIIGVDCYYLTSRPQSYMKRHHSHFILVYGYDLEKDLAYVVDHDYINSFDYKEKEISLSNLLFANKKFRRMKLWRRGTCYILKKQEKKDNEINIWDNITEDQIKKNQINSMKNLTTLDRLFACDLETAKAKEEKIFLYLQDIKTFYFALSKTRFFKNNLNREAEIMRVISGYSNILSLLWKVKIQKNYEYITKRLDVVRRKLNEIKQNETSMYVYLLGLVKRNG